MFSHPKRVAATSAMILVTVGGLVWGTAAPAQAALARQSIARRSVLQRVCSRPSAREASAPNCIRVRGRRRRWSDTRTLPIQPLAPQEFLYRHARHYTTWHEDAPPTRTSVHWGRCWW